MADDSSQGAASKVIDRLLDIDAIALVLMLLGAALFILALAGGITYNNWLPIPDLIPRLIAGSVGIVVFLFGVYKARTRKVILNIRPYGIKIHSPREGVCPGTTNVTGSITKPLPENFNLCVLRIYPGPGRFVPMRDVTIKLDKKRWEALQCDIGGKPGDERIIGAYVVGPDGTALLEYYKKASAVHKEVMNALRESTGKEAEYLPLIEKGTADMIECDRVYVTRA